jgi:hypothetical protein
VLAGRVRQVTGSLTAQSRQHGLTESQRAGVEACVRLATASISPVPGGATREPRPVLRLRAVIDDGDFEAYWAFHLRRKQYRVHPARRQDGYDLIA